MTACIVHIPKTLTTSNGSPRLLSPQWALQNLWDSYYEFQEKLLKLFREPHIYIADIDSSHGDNTPLSS